MKPFSAELKIAFAVVTLFLGWLLAVMIPQHTTTAQDWVVRKSWSADRAPDGWYLDGQGTLLGKAPEAEVETEFALQVQSHEKATASQVKSSDQITAQAGSRFAQFDPETKTVSGGQASSSEQTQTADNASGKGTTASDKSVAKSPASSDKGSKPDLLALNGSQWQASGIGNVQEEQQKWAEEVKAAIPKAPKVEPRPMPNWDDPVAKAPPLTEPRSSAKASSPVKKETKPQSPSTSTKSDQVATSDKTLKNDKDKERQTTSVAKANPKSDIVAKQGDKSVKGSSVPGTSESFSPIAITTPQKDSVKGKAPAPLSIASSKPDTVKAHSADSSKTAPAVQPLAAAKSPTSSSPAQSTVSTAKSTPTTQTTVARSLLVVDPGYSGKAWIPPRPRQPASVSLIRSEIPQGPPVISPTDYSTPISKTVGRIPTEVRFDVLGEEQRHVPTPVRSTSSRPNNTGTTPATLSTVTLPSSVQTVRVLDATTPEDFARSRNMDRARYTRFYEYNKYKLDSSGTFPAKTLLFVPD